MIKEVIKADGSVEKFDLDKLGKWAKYASKVGGDWSELAIETFSKLPEKCDSSVIHQTMIDVCYAKQNLTYSRVAARLELATLRKNIERVFGLKAGECSFKELREAMLVSKLWSEDVIPPYSDAQEKVYKELTEVRHESYQIAQWGDKYLLRKGDLELETIPLAAMGIALGVHGDTQDAYDLASDIVYGRTNLPTPTLNGVRNNDFDSISCTVISAGDSVESIEVAQHLATRMTAKKAGIGIEFTTRSLGSDVKGGRVKHLGKHTIYRHTDTGVKQFQQVTRGGSATVSFVCIDPEVENIILWKSQRVDIDKRIDKLDYSFLFNDAFLEAVVNRDKWYLIDYLDAPDVHDMFYKGSVKEYNSLVAKKIKEGVRHIEIDAIELVKTFLLVRQETGRMYCFNVSRANEHTPFEDTIRLSNLCVAPETQILTRDGYVAIKDVAGKEVEVWNGEEWSKTTPRKTGENQKLVKVNLSSGQSIDCTEYHKFYIQNGFSRGKISLKRAFELEEGDKLIKFDLPIVETGDKELEFAYTNGFYTGDGCYHKGVQITYLYHDKKKLLQHLEDVKTYSESEDRVIVRHRGSLKDKFFVPLEGYSVESRVKWLSGLFDADGCVSRNGENESLQITSVHLEFLRQVQMLLQTLGIHSKITQLCEDGFRPLPANDGTGEKKEFFCKASWRLLVSSGGLFKLSQLGFNTKRLVWTERLPQREATQFVTVLNVIDEGRKDDTYCFTEPKRNMGVFNGVLTGNCQEIALPTHPYSSMEDLYNDTTKKAETAFCALGAIVPANIDSDEEYERVAYTLVKTINKLIERCPKMTINHERTMLERMSVGIGITGLADWMYKNGYDYDGSEESLKAVHTLAEKHAFYLYKASVRLAKETGKSVKGIKKDWLPIDTKRSKYDSVCDWESLRGQTRANSVLVANMPTESSAVASGVSNGLYCIRKPVINKKSRKGVVQFISKWFDGNKHLTAWDIPNITMSKYYGVVQDWTDQAISADTYFDPRKHEGGKRNMSDLIKEWVAHFRLGNKSMYYVNTYDNDEVSVFDIENTEVEDEEDCEGCRL